MTKDPFIVPLNLIDLVAERRARILAIEWDILWELQSSTSSAHTSSLILHISTYQNFL